MKTFGRKRPAARPAPKAARPDLADRRGSVAIITALLAPVFVGGLAIAVDAAYWRTRIQTLQSAADAAAIGAYYSANMGMRNQLLALDAAQEAAKNGCGAYCTTTLNSSGSGSSQTFTVTVTDTRPKQSFSAAFGLAPRSLSASATSGQGTVSSYTMTMQDIPTPDDGCLLSFGQITFWGDTGDAAAGVPSKCSLIANGTQADGSSTNTFAGWSWSSGNTTMVMQSSPGSDIGGSFADKAGLAGTMYTAFPYISIGNYLHWGEAPLWTDTGFHATAQAPVADPYLGIVNITSSNAGAYNDSFTDATTAAEMSLSPDGTSVNNAPAAGNLGLGGTNPFKGFTWNSATSTWTISGGARFKAGLKLDPGTKVAMLNGTYVFEQDASWTGATVSVTNGTLVLGTNSAPARNYSFDMSTGYASVMVYSSNLDMTRVPGEYIWGPGTTVAVSAPTAGPMAGVAVAGFTDATYANGGEITLKLEGSAAAPTNLYIVGDIYFPKQSLLVVSGAYVTAGLPGNTQGGGACGRVLVAQVISLTKMDLGYTCTLANGVQPFGTPFSQLPASAHWASGTKRMMAPATTSTRYGRIIQ